MRSRVLVLAIPFALASGCSFDVSGLGPGDAGKQVDGAASGDALVPADARPVATCAPEEARLPFAATNIGPCVPEPEGVFEVPAFAQMRIDTDAMTREDVGEGDDPVPLSSAVVLEQGGDAPELLVISVDQVRIANDARVRAEGSRALILVSHGDIEVEAGAFLTVRGLFQSAGAGAFAAACEHEGGRGTDGAAQDYDGDDGGSGGGGGGYGSPGGAGAAVQGSEEEEASPGGAANGDDTDRLEPLRGGCRGGDGFAVSGDDESGRGGAAGGAIQLVAAGAIIVQGNVSASGGGAAAGAALSGGGGGGSGGAVLLEARELAITGAVTSNGGGGGQGMRRIGSFGACSSPQDGAHGFRTLDDPAPGGDSSCSTAGAGGGGDAATVDAAAEGQMGDSDFDSGFTGQSPAPAGGGGGGGGSGRIRVSACDPIRIDGAVLSPAPSISQDLGCYE